MFQTGNTLVCSNWNTVLFGTDGSALKMLPELTEQRVKPKTGSLIRCLSGSVAVFE